MIFREFLFYILFALFVYFFIIRPYILKKNNFVCRRCGHCCRLRVKLSEEDIQMLNKSGEKDFLEKRNWLRRINGYCKFLEIKNGKARCNVYKYRPRICRQWPLRKNSVDIRCKFYSKKFA